MRYLPIIMVVLLFFAVGCGEKEEFVINCEVSGLESRGVEMFYTTSQGLQRASFHPVDGKVELKGVAASPVMVEVFTLDNKRLFACIVSNGDELTVKVDPSNPGSIENKSNEASEQYAAFMAANAKTLGGNDREAVNSLVASEVRANPKNLASAMILATCFDAEGHELQADSLIDILSSDPAMIKVMGSFVNLVRDQVVPSARGNLKPITFHTARDTVAIYAPSNQSYSLIAFVGQNKGDSVKRVLRRLHKKLPAKRFKVLEIAMTGDSLSWSASIKGDSAKWMQAWAPGGAAHAALRPYRIGRLPYFIVADSLGRQLYRGTAVSVAEDSVERHLKAYLTD